MEIAGLTNLCPPAKFYLVISIISIIVIGLQNTNSANKYCLGSYSCEVSSVGLIFMVKLIYVFFWTWILNLICRSGATPVAWFLVLIPFILFFILLAILLGMSGPFL
uniref:Uncharacterized protein n=1 Tax=viral metagenome TaxID=1070528 RepID=A0A6C0I439_9ZZZZ